MELLQESGTPVHEVRRPPDSLLECEEIFTTNSLLEIMPVGKVDDQPFPGREQTLALHKQFRSFRDALQTDSV